jgi:iron complex transport system substrate-binding protein
MSTARTRLATLLAGVAAAALLLSGCASPEADETTASQVSDDRAFPVTIEHKFGETTIDEAPERVVLVGLNEQDALLALGVVPVAVTFWGANSAEGGIGAWAEDLLGDSALPEVLDSSDGVEMEKIAALEPDLIIGQYAGLTEEEHAELSKIAPTVAQPGEYADWGVPWEVATVNVGKAVGKQSEAEALVEEVDALIAEYATENEELFAGQTGIVAAAWDGIFLYGPEDPRARLMVGLGIAFPEELKNEDPSLFGWSISAERAGELGDVDVVHWGASSEIVSETYGRVWDETAAAQEGRAIYLDYEKSSPAFTASSNFVTVLSIPYFLERFVPQLVAALDGDPATEVPQILE